MKVNPNSVKINDKVFYKDGLEGYGTILEIRNSAYLIEYYDDDGILDRKCITHESLSEVLTADGKHHV